MEGTKKKEEGKKEKVENVYKEERERVESGGRRNKNKRR